MKKVTIFDIAIIGIASAILIIAQLSLAALPNVELVTMLIIMYTLYFKWKTPYIIYIFVLVEGLIFGFSLWFISYLYIWVILFLIAYAFRNINSVTVWSVICAIFGLLFGTLTSLPYLFIGGFNMAVAYIISGIPFDIVHCISNFFIFFILFKPLSRVFLFINKKYNQ